LLLAVFREPNISVVGDMDAQDSAVKRPHAPVCTNRVREPRYRARCSLTRKRYGVVYNVDGFWDIGQPVLPARPFMGACYRVPVDSEVEPEALPA
jgi:hypothetical protein